MMVGRFQVPVSDSFFVRGFESFGDLLGVLEGGAQRQR
jgi:hypothetical protein